MTVKSDRRHRPVAAPRNHKRWLLIISVVALLTAVATPFINDALEGDPPNLEIVDASISNRMSRGSLDRERKQVALLDLKVANRGGSSALITGVSFDVRRIWFLRFLPLLAQLRPSARYTVAMPLLRQTPYPMHESISQEVKAGRADRFVIRIVPDEPLLEGPLHDNMALVLSRVALIHDGGATTELDKPILFSTQIFGDADSFLTGCRFDPLATRTALNQKVLRRVLTEVDRLEPIRSSLIEELFRTADKAAQTPCPSYFRR